MFILTITWSSFAGVMGILNFLICDTKKEESTEESYLEGILPQWKAILDRWEDMIQKILAKVEERRRQVAVYPPRANVFYWAKVTDLDTIQVVIVGQDPYHQPGEAMGLAFSVPQGKRIPPSLRNIINESASSKQVSAKKNGDLTTWAKQGVLLLNTILTVENSKPGSHEGYGWQEVTSGVIREISRRNQNVVFMLWGKHAAGLRGSIECQENHRILMTAHPSPLSARYGFINCGHFTAANEYLIQHNKMPIKWDL